MKYTQLIRNHYTIYELSVARVFPLTVFELNGLCLAVHTTARIVLCAAARSCQSHCCNVLTNSSYCVDTTE
jgi:hypothetical protein